MQLEMVDLMMDCSILKEILAEASSTGLSTIVDGIDNKPTDSDINYPDMTDKFNSQLEITRSFLGTCQKL